MPAARADGQRLYRDGRRFTYSALRWIVVEGREVAEPAPLKWRRDPQSISTSSGAEVESAIRTTIGRGHLQPSSEAVHAVAHGPDHTTITYRAWVDGREYMYVLIPREEDLPTMMTPIEGTISEGIMGRAPLA